MNFVGYVQTYIGLAASGLGQRCFLCVGLRLWEAKIQILHSQSSEVKEEKGGCSL